MKSSVNLEKIRKFFVILIWDVILQPLKEFLGKKVWHISLVTWVASITTVMVIFIRWQDGYSNRPFTWYVIVAIFIFYIPTLIVTILFLMNSKRRDDFDLFFLGTLSVCMMVFFSVCAFLAGRSALNGSPYTSEGLPDKQFLIWSKDTEPYFSDTYPIWAWDKNVRPIKLAYQRSSAYVEQDYNHHRYALHLVGYFHIEPTDKNARLIVKQAKRLDELSIADYFSGALSKDLNLKLAPQMINQNTEALNQCQFPEIQIKPLTQVPPSVFDLDVSNMNVTGTLWQSIILEPVASN